MGKIIKPHSMGKTPTVGIFTPSSPAHIWFAEKYQHAKRELEKSGFQVLEGNLTKKAQSQGYRTGTGRERAREFMELIENDQVDILMATIGGSNSSSMLPYLDYQKIREKRKIITGYSDLTALQMGILTQSGLSCFYGPAVIPTFGEYAGVFPESLASFKMMAQKTDDTPYVLPHFPQWSNHFMDAFSDDWKNTPREYQDNDSPQVLVPGQVSAPLLIANVNTLCALGGSRFFPQIDGQILFLEQMDVHFDQEERMWRQLDLMGVFDRISGLVIGKPEKLNTKKAPFSYEDLIREIVGKRDYPIVSGFDCGHTHPSHCLGQMVDVQLDASDKAVKVTLLSACVV